MTKKTTQKTGKIIAGFRPHLEEHEWDTIEYFRACGKTVELIKPSGTKKQNSADIVMDGKIYEIKSPDGNSRWTIEKQFARASRQAEHMIFDARRLGFPNRLRPDKNYVESEVEKQFRKKRRIKTLILILKNGHRKDFTK
jgi:hypothetical protein